MIASGFLVSNFLVFMMVGSGAMPLSMPPLPEDATLQRVAPEECLWYLSWSGTAEPDANSKNRTEQILAQAEVKQFATEITKRVMESMEKEGARHPRDVVPSREVPKLVKTLLTRPMAIFLSKVSVGPRGPLPVGGLIVNLGDQAEATKQSLIAVLKSGFGDELPAISDDQWNKFPMPPGAPVVEWGIRGKYFVLGMGEGAAQGMIDRGRSEPPTWLTKIRAKLQVDRVSMTHYLNAKGVIEFASPLLGPDFARVLGATGVNKLVSIANVSGLDGPGYVNKAWLQTDGKPSGVFDLIGSTPLTAADLSVIPKDASVAMAGKVDVSRVYKQILDLIVQIEPRAAERMPADIARMEQGLGFRISEDLLQSFGDTWCVYNSPGEGGLLVTGLTAVVTVKDKAKLVSINDKLIALAKQQNDRGPAQNFGRRPRGVEIGEQKVAGQTVYYLKFIGEAVPVSPAWCITDKHLVLSTNPQNVRAFLSRKSGGGSLADVPSVAEQLKTGPVMLGYHNTPETLKMVYPLLQMGFNALTGEMLSHGVDIDSSLLPSLASVLPYVDASSGSIVRQEDGYVATSRGTLPLEGALIIAPLALPLMYMSARDVHVGHAIAPAIEARPALPEQRFEPGELKREIEPGNLELRELNLDRDLLEPPVIRAPSLKDFGTGGVEAAPEVPQLDLGPPVFPPNAGFEEKPRPRPSLPPRLPPPAPPKRAPARVAVPS